MKLLTQWAVTSSALILIVLAVRYLFREKLSARLRYALWGIVLLRLLVPFQVELPADTSAALPVLASNFAPEVADMELYALRTQSTPLMEESLQAMKDYGHKAGDVIAYETNIHHIGSREVEGGTHCFVLSETSVDKYFFYTTLPKFLMTLWVIGAVWVALTIFRSNRYFFGRLKYYRHELEGVEAPIPVYTAANLSSPCLFGVLRPAVYLSPGAADNPVALRHILAHELTHYAHRDHLWSLLRCLALALHWYNPLVWLAVALSKGDGELACDEGAVARLGEAERIPYGRTLVDMVAARSLRPGDLLSCSTAMTGGKKSIQQRVARLVNHPETVKTAVFGAAAVLVLAAVFVFAGREESGEPGPADAFLAQVQEAQAIGIGNPVISSVFEPGDISDPEALAQAKELLSQTTPVAYLEGAGWDVLSLDSNHPPEYITQEELESQFFIGGHPLNLFPTLDKDIETAHRYWLIRTEDDTLLAQWYPEREEDTVELLAALPSDAIPRLKALARAPDNVPPVRRAAFLEQAEEAVSIQIEEGTAESPDELGPITDPEWLEAARAALLSLAPLPDDVSVITSFSEEQLRHETGSGLYAITLTDSGGGAITYYIDRRPSINTDYLVFPMSEYPAEDSLETARFYRVGVLSGEAVYALHLAAKVSNGILPPPTGYAKPDLTGAEEPDRVHPAAETEKPDTDDEKDEWEQQQAAEYQAAGVMVDGKNYYYQGQLVNIFLDIRANQSFYTLDTNPAGTVNVKISRDAEDKIAGVEYMTDEEAAELLDDMRD